MWLLRPRIGSPGCCLSETNFCPPFGSQPPVGSLFSAPCPLCPILFQGAGFACGPCSFSCTGLGIAWTTRLLFLGLPLVASTSSGGKTSLVCVRGVSLAQLSPDLDFWSDASDVGWGAHLGPDVVSGLWSPEEAGVSINARELLAVEKGLLHFQASLVGSTVTVFVANSTVVAYLRKSGGTRSLLLNELAQRILRWSELHRVTLALQFIPGCRNVLADSLSRPHQLLGSEWTLHADVFRDLCCQWPVMVDLFATSANHRCSIYFSPFRDPQSAGTDAFLQSWDGLLAYAFPPWSVIPQVLTKLRASQGTYLTLVAPYWPQRPWFPELLYLAVAPPVVLPSRPDRLFQPQSGLRYPGLLRLRLLAWRLSGDSLGQLVSPPV